MTVVTGIADDFQHKENRLEAENMISKDLRKMDDHVLTGIFMELKTNESLGDG